MFGYIRPCKPELRIREFEMYRGVYCSLCRSIGKNYGFAARLTLSFDCTFLAMVSLSLDEGCCGFRKGRCGANPLKRCTYLKEDGGRLEYAATVSVLLTYCKLKDNLHDHGIGNRIAAFLLLPFLYFPMKKARKRYAALHDQVMEAMAEQSAMEESEEIGIDGAAHPMAALLEGLFSGMTSDERQKKPLGRLGYYIGRWVYLMDAADDRADDQKKGNFNPFNRGEQEYSGKQIDGILTLTLNRAIAAFDLVTVHHFHDILLNILTLGLTGVQQDILKIKGNEHDGSL